MKETDMHSLREEMIKRSRKEIDAIFALAGLDVRRVWELANGYWPLAPDYDAVRAPWWLLDVDALGLVQIGRRKRVIAIDWEACSFRGVVTADDVTKGDTMVHAYTTEKAVEYLRELKRLRRRQLGDMSAAVQT
jgi:hypothetical protein